MSDFPNLNMSIGEYYKLLMEGKRPTRQRTTKEEMKQGTSPSSMTPNPPGLGRAISTGGPGTSAGGISQSRRDSGLARSQSEIT